MSMSNQTDCIFCNIIQKKIPCVSIYNSDNFIALLDINPVNKGHTLIVPTQHVETMFDIDPSLGTDLLSIMQHIGPAIMKATNAEGVNVIQNNYVAAGQEVPHLHWHIIPRFIGDSRIRWEKGKYKNHQEMIDIATNTNSIIYNDYS